MTGIRACAALATLLLVSSTAMGCGSADDAGAADFHADEEEGENVGTVQSALVASDPISAAVGQSCSTMAVKGLATQLVAEIQCLKPGSMTRIDNKPGLSLGASVFPWLQTPAANALFAAQKARGETLSINSGLRTLPQQYLLYRWYQTGRCGISLAAAPGQSNHESAIALDIGNNASWRTAMQGNNFRWLGSNDPVHFDYVGGGAVDMRGLSVRAFQRLWNRNNPTDKISEDGSYGAQTESRLAKAPVGGFAIGAQCTDVNEGDAPPVTPDANVPAIPDATEPTGERAGVAGDDDRSLTSAELPSYADDASEGGCAVARARSREGVGGGALLIVGLALGARRRRTCG